MHVSTQHICSIEGKHIKDELLSIYNTQRAGTCTYPFSIASYSAYLTYRTF